MAKKLIFTIIGFLFLIACRNEFLDENLLTKKNFDTKKSTFNSLILLPYHIDWSNETLGYSEHLKSEIKSYPILIDIQQNPENNDSYQLIVSGDEKQELYLLKISPNQNSINQKASLLNQDKFTGQLKLFDVAKNLIVDKKFRNGVESIDNNHSVTQKLDQVCVTETTYHYTDWYKKMSDGRLVYSHTTLDDITYETDCYLIPGGDNTTSNTFTSDTKYREISNQFFDDSMDEVDLCGKAKLPSYTATQNSKSDAFYGAKTSITSMNNGKENGVVLGIVNNKVQSTTVQTGNEYSIGNLTSSFLNPIGDIHNHPNNNPPSPGDFYSLINARNQYSNYNTRYVVTQDGTTYALVVTDPSAMNTFLQNYPPSITPNPNGGNYINFPQSLFEEWTDLKLDFSESGALAYILNKYNSGITLTKMDAAGNFRAVNITTTQNADGTTSYNYSLCPN